jgi:hypothetical protein
MSKQGWDRFAALGGVAFVVLYIVGAVLPGEPPAVDDPAADVAAFFNDNRVEFLSGMLLIGFGVVAFLWFVSSLVATLRSVGEERLANAAFGGFLAFIGLGSLAALVRASLAYGVATDVEPAQVLGLYHMAAVIDVFSSLFFAAFAAAVAGASLRTGFLPRWFGFVSIAVALGFVAAATTWSRSGFWSPTGGAIWIMTVVWLLYILVMSILHFRRVGAGAASASG